MPQLFGSEFRLDPSRPIYLQIIERFQEAVARGVLKPGDQIPAQRDLAQRIGVNPNTVQRAYREMEYMGLVETARGTGTFVTLDPGRVQRLREELAREAVTECIRRLQDLGYSRDEIARRVLAALGVTGSGAARGTGQSSRSGTSPEADPAAPEPGSSPAPVPAGPVPPTPHAPLPGAETAGSSGAPATPESTREAGAPEGASATTTDES
ncbi:transcriptional regulator, GntR family [Thermaerobacter marianensis DSM 12885]|uniref:Transcriptional regulator, GntR family n=1 Tax=Thermaerobacter marianensis (strain ATCC 700841 / DSM 12885 / JCM 10246 / 7p75a) TaxID=644966 RepID=E6SHN4_THEM7|nr:GntR family transcriptional regulator [Thermaerobacter marianensis]ADU51829.1 transcriptional regulator, GntR family [Thermaerobacter marianensis DSM 12885]